MKKELDSLTTAHLSILNTSLDISFKTTITTSFAWHILFLFSFFPTSHLALYGQFLKSAEFCIITVISTKGWTVYRALLRQAKLREWACLEKLKQACSILSWLYIMHC